MELAPSLNTGYVVYLKSFISDHDYLFKSITYSHQVTLAALWSSYSWITPEFHCGSRDVETLDRLARDFLINEVFGLLRMLCIEESHVLGTGYRLDMYVIMVKENDKTQHLHTLCHIRGDITFSCSLFCLGNCKTLQYDTHNSNLTSLTGRCQRHLP